MKYAVFIFVGLLLLAGCRQPEKSKSNDLTRIENSQTLTSVAGPLTDTTLYAPKTAIHIFTTPVVNGLLVLSATAGDLPALRDTIAAVGLDIPGFPDFNGDGYPDILLSYQGSNHTSFLYLFDPATYTFHPIEGFVAFPDAQQLKSNPDLYYSYYGVGCNDLNWISDLFTMVNFKTVRVGHMYGKGCSLNVLENPQFIGLFKIDSVNNQSEWLVEKLPYQQFIPDNESKQAFIKNYWNSNYRKFK